MATESVSVKPPEGVKSVNRDVLLSRADYVAIATVGIQQGTGEEIEIFLLR